MRWFGTLAACVLGIAGPIAAQSTTSYIVRQPGAEAGRERLTLRSGTERSADGVTLSVESSYGPAGAVSAVLQRAPSGELLLFRLRATGPAPATILAATNGGRLAVRRESGGAESARELPARPGTLLLDEQAWSLLAAVAESASPRGTPLLLIFPRANRTLRTTATRAGATVTLAGELAGTITLDAAGHLLKAELPGMQVSLQRVDD